MGVHKADEVLELEQEYRNAAAELPEHMQDIAIRYVLYGEPVGTFLAALLSDSLVEVYRRADAENMIALGRWALWLYWEVPVPAWGSREAVQRWQERGGLIGRRKEHQDNQEEEEDA